MTKMKMTNNKVRETSGKRRESGVIANDQLKKIIGGIMEEEGRDKMYEERGVGLRKKEKETIDKTIDKGNLGRDEKVKDGGAGPGETVKGKGASQGQDTGDFDGSHHYPLVGPRPEEAPDIDNSTIVQCTGTERSPVRPLDVMNNALYSQHLEEGRSDEVQDASGRGTRQGEAYKGGEGGRSAKRKGAGRKYEGYKGGGAGGCAKREDKGAGRGAGGRRVQGRGSGAGR